jgi:hypothetical protein
MDTELTGVEADRPSTLTDCQPAIIRLGDYRARAPGAADYRIALNLEDAIPGFDATDLGIVLLYCCLHTSRAAIAELCRKARDPDQLWEDVMVWMATEPPKRVAPALEAVAEYDEEYAAEAELEPDSDEPDGKKKIT